MTDFDLTPATDQLAALVAAVPDGDLDGPTPCEATPVGALLDHIGGLSIAFTVAATKEELPGGPVAPSADAAHLPEGWRTEIPARLQALATAWREPGAWEGMTMAGPVEMPAPVAALVALDEVMIHGWDLARATGQPFVPDPALLEVLHGFVSGFAGPGKEADREGLSAPRWRCPPTPPSSTGSSASPAATPAGPPPDRPPPPHLR